jgi:hypothetical protein
MMWEVHSNRFKVQTRMANIEDFIYESNYSYLFQTNIHGYHVSHYFLI